MSVPNSAAKTTNEPIKPYIAMFGRWTIDDNGVRRCRECRHEISGQEMFCPECGLPLQYSKRRFSDANIRDRA